MATTMMVKVKRTDIGPNVKVLFILFFVVMGVTVYNHNVFFSTHHSMMSYYLIECCVHSVQYISLIQVQVLKQK